MKKEFTRLRDNALIKREALIKTAHKKNKYIKGLTITAGVLSLISAASITSILAEFTPALGMKIFAAVLSTLSGLISLLTNFSFKESQIFDIYAGAAQYLILW